MMSVISQGIVLMIGLAVWLIGILIVAAVAYFVIKKAEIGRASCRERV